MIFLRRNSSPCLVWLGSLGSVCLCLHFADRAASCCGDGGGFCVYYVNRIFVAYTVTLLHVCALVIMVIKFFL